MVDSTDTINIVELVENVMQDLHPLIVASNAKIEVICEADPLLQISKKHLKSIMHNPLSNALKYHSPDRTPEVLVKTNKLDGKIIISVQDNGLGIPTEKQEDVFSMFKRFHDHVEGSGVGLYLVKKMVDNMKGKILVNSALNQGTTFTIVL